MKTGDLVQNNEGLGWDGPAWSELCDKFRQLVKQ